MVGIKYQLGSPSSNLIYLNEIREMLKNQKVVGRYAVSPWAMDEEIKPKCRRLSVFICKGQIITVVIERRRIPVAAATVHDKESFNSNFFKTFQIEGL